MTAPPGAGPAPEQPQPAQPSPPEGPVAAGDAESPAAGAAPAAGSEPVPEQDSFTVGPGGDAAEATSRYGQGTRRGEYLRDAGGRDTGQGFGIGGRGYFTGDTRLSPLPSRLVDPIERAFVRPACLPEMRAAFEKRYVVVLRGPDGYGKRGLAIHLLLDSVSRLFQIDQSADLARLREWIEAGDGEDQRIDRNAGFILDHPSGVANLQSSVLQGLEEALFRADARLVLILGSEVMVTDELHDYVIDVASAPDCDEIAASHLRFLAGREMAERLLGRSDIREFISQELGANATCRLAAELAAELADDVSAASDTGIVDIARIKAGRLRRGAETFDLWFTGLEDTQSRCFAVALAVLNGLPYDTVAKAARALRRRFDASPYMVAVTAQEPLPDIQRPFVASRQDWLHRLQARIRESEVRGACGNSHAQIIEYKDDAQPQRVIGRAWSDYQAQDSLLDWLGELAEDVSEQVRILAGKALGQLAVWSFDHLSQNILGPWATGRRCQREAVAYALMFVAGHDSRLHENVRRLIAGWYQNHRKPLAQATAARAYGLVRAAIDRTDALDALDRLATVDDIRVAVAIGDALTDLVDDSTDGFACQVLERLAGHLDDNDMSATIELAFLILADGLLASVPADGQAHEVSWPFLLRLAAKEAQARAALVRLWRHVINGARFVDEAAQVMTEWAAVTEADPQLQEAFLRLVRAVTATDDRSRGIFARYAAVWSSASNFKPLPKASTAVQAILDAERTLR
jgi:hypothetical protein